MTRRKGVETFGQRLRRLRHQSGYLQQEAAALSGTPDRTYRNWENDQSHPRYDGGPRMRRLAELYEVSVLYLFTGSDE